MLELKNIPCLPADKCFEKLPSVYEFAQLFCKERSRVTGASQLEHRPPRQFHVIRPSKGENWTLDMFENSLYTSI